MSGPGPDTRARRVLGIGIGSAVEAGTGADARAHPEADAADPPEPPCLTLYVKRGCGLCDEMEQLLHELLPVGSFRLRRLDIQSDASLMQRLGERIPVLMLGDQELCHHFVDLQAVRQALELY